MQYFDQCIRPIAMGGANGAGAFGFRRRFGSGEHYVKSCLADPGSSHKII
jgi:hypothetical protein